MKISGLVITLNEEKNIEDCIKSMSLVCDDIVVVDSLSTDKTCDILENLNVTVIRQKYLGDGPQRSYGLPYCKNDWVLNIDADERVDEELAQTIKQLNLEGSQFDAYEFRRKNIFHNKWIKHSDWYPDYIRRLFNKTKVDFSQVVGHTKIESNNYTKINQGHIVHYTAENYHELLFMLNKYSTRQAKVWFDQGRKVRLYEPFTHGFFAFFRAYILRRGFLDGIEGFNISISKGLGSYLKYMKLHELYQLNKTRD